MLWGLLGTPFDFDFDGHVGISDIVLLLIMVSAIAAAAKVIRDVAVYLRARSQKQFVRSVVRAMQPELDIIHERVKSLDAGQLEVLKKLDTIRDEIHPTS